MPGPRRTDFGERTIPEIVLNRTEQWPDVVVTMHRENGDWIPTKWSEFGELTLSLASGFRELGLEPGQAVSIVAGTSRDWLVTDMATTMAGGITVGVYTTITAEQSHYIIDHAESRIVVVENKDLFNKISGILDQIPTVRNVVLIDPEGVNLDGEKVLSWMDVIERGRKQGTEGRRALVEEAGAREPGQIATYVYTSGTTGPPKAAMLNHANILAAMHFYASVFEFGDGECSISFLPLAHMLQRTIDYLVLYVGATIYYAHSVQTIREDIREASPTAMASVPRIFEKIYAGVLSRANESGTIARALFNWAIGVGRRVSALKQESRPLPAGLTLSYAVARFLVFRKVKEAMGGRIRLCGSGGAPLSREIAEFFHACDILILEAWGMTETTAMGTLTRPDDFKFGTVGKPADGVEIRIAEDGEILMRGPNVFPGYYKEPELTAETVRDGWIHTGDIGEFDTEGYLMITDRKKDLIINSYGKNIAPQNIENTLKSSPYISQAMAFGDRQKYLVGLVTLDPEEIEKWAISNEIKFENLTDLCDHPALLVLVDTEIGRINKKLASYEGIRKFTILPGDFSIEGGELTPTLKLKRKVVIEKYQDNLKDLYGDDWNG